ncbi:hypothetical protein [Patulibacter minatonensis]|uniref:hypothetical protein n=1 Tax=Patulibacter minatonensis TaxID=298163 RepID=UPI00047BD8DB|nr:hypothetical protein [Patulibacter minatonensis]
MIVLLVIGVLLVLYGAARVFNVGGLATRTQQRAERIEERRRQQGGAPQEVPENLAQWLGKAFIVVGLVVIAAGLIIG